MRRLLAEWLNKMGNDAAASHQRDRAIRFYEKAAKADPTWSVPFFNLGLEAKFQGHWPQSLDYNQHPVQFSPTDEGAWWNLGIAATALRDWPQARQAWRNAGIDVPPGDGEWTWAPGAACVRPDPECNGEVVWGDRIDPARVVISSVPLAASNHRFRDIVLIDGAANGTRAFHGVDVPVFDELEVWQPSPYATFQVTLGLPTQTATETLAEICLNRDLGFEDWSSIRMLCKQCSEGNPGPHTCSNAPNFSRTRSIAIAAPSRVEVEQAIQDWNGLYSISPKVEIELLLPAA